MGYKAVIFDFNGTLFFDNDKHILAWNLISKHIRGHGISEDELHQKFNGTPNAQIIQYLIGSNVSEDIINKYSSLKERYYREFCYDDKSTFHLVKGVEEYFDKLKELLIPFTIASASIKENIDFFVKSFNLDRWIAPSDIVYDNGTYLNKIEMFKDAALNLNCDIKDVLVFEDSFSGITNAYNAGVRKIVVVCQENEEMYKKLPGVIKIIQDFSCMDELIDII